MTMWSLWAVAECEAHTIEILYNRISKPAEDRDEVKVQACIAALRAPFAVLGRELAANGHPVGGRFTVADINIAEVLRYAQPAAELFEGTPHVKAWLDACQARPAFKAMAAMREAEPA